MNRVTFLFTVLLVTLLAAKGRGAKEVNLNATAANVQIFNSPNYPDQHYNNNLNMVWVITAPTGHTVELTFTYFSTEFYYDYVIVSDGGSDTSIPMANFSGTHFVRLPLTLPSTGTQMRIKFESDGSFDDKGFNASYVAVPIPGLRTCKENKTGHIGFFASPNYPSNYSNNEDCLWNITVPVGYKVQLTFLFFETEEIFDEVEIFDGPNQNSTYFGGYSEKNFQPVFTSSGRSMLIKLTSDQSIVKRGFHAKFDAVSAGVRIK